MFRRAAHPTCASLSVFLLASLLLLAVWPPHDAKAQKLGRKRGVRLRNLAHEAALTDCLLASSITFVDSARNTSKMYFEAAQGDNVRFHFHPLAIAYPATAEQVSMVVQCAAKNGHVPTVARSGGHSFAGFSSGGQDGALIVAMGRMDVIQSDAKLGLATVQPGARLGDIVKKLWTDGKRGTPHGTCPTVAMGGHALCGGFGPTSRHWGMATDNVVEAEVVLANGSMVRASQHENAELWWGLRGAGSYYGIVTRFTMQTYHVDHATVHMEYRWTASLKSLDDVVHLMQAIQDFALAEHLPSALGFHVQAQPPSRHDPPGGIVAVHLRGMYLGSLMTLRSSVLPSLWDALQRKGLPGKPDASVEKETSYLHVMEEWDDFGKPENKLDTMAERARHNNFVQRTFLTIGQRGFSAGGFRTIFQGLWQRSVDEAEGRLKDRKNAQHSRYWNWNIYFELFGGAQNRLREADLTQASVMAHRNALWLIQASVGAYEDAPLAHVAYAFLHHLQRAVLHAFHADKLERRSFSCYIDATLDDWKSLYYGDVVPRMVALKQAVDPMNLFRTPQSLIRTPASPSLPNEGPWLKHVHPLP